MCPNDDQIEVTLLGPGYGECVVVNLGNNNWIIIDSCIDLKTNKPAALSYFQNIGINPSKVVKLIIATHWHDDHIRGLSNILKVCDNARFCCSSALTHREFLTVVFNYEDKITTSISSGLKELSDIYKLLKDRSGKLRTPIYANQNKLIFKLDSENSGHGKECNVWALSPSDLQYQKFSRRISHSYAPSQRNKKKGYPSESK